MSYRGRGGDRGGPRGLPRGRGGPRGGGVMNYQTSSGYGYGGPGENGGRDGPDGPPMKRSRHDMPENHILLITVENPKYPITVNVIHAICKQYGEVLRIVIFKKQAVQALVEFDSIASANNAKSTLQGADIYSGCCTLNIEYGKPDRLTVKKNDDETYDFTNLNLPASYEEGNGFGGGQQRRTLLDAPQDGGAGGMGGPGGPMGGFASGAGGQGGGFNSYSGPGGAGSGGYGGPSGGGVGSGGYGGPSGGGGVGSGGYGGQAGSGAGGPGAGGPGPGGYGGPGGPGGGGPGGFGGPAGGGAGGYGGPGGGGPGGYGGPGGGGPGGYGGPGGGGPGGYGGPGGAGSGGYGPAGGYGNEGSFGGGNGGGGGWQGGPGPSGPMGSHMRGPMGGPDSMGMGPGGDGPVGGCVMMVYGLDKDKFNCDRLFNILCLYGNVMKVKFLKSKEDTAMVEMGDPIAVEKCIEMLHNMTIFKNRVQIRVSKQEYLTDQGRPFQLPDGSDSYVDFSGSRNNRYTTPEKAAKNRYQPPCKSLHFYNSPPKMSLDDVKKIFEDRGAPIPKEVIPIETKDADRSSAGSLLFETDEDAIEALVIVNHTELPSPSGKQPYIFKVCFSASAGGRDGPRGGGRGGPRGGFSSRGRGDFGRGGYGGDDDGGYGGPRGGGFDGPRGGRGGPRGGFGGRGFGGPRGGRGGRGGFHRDD